MSFVTQSLYRCGVALVSSRCAKLFPALWLQGAVVASGDNQGNFSDLGLSRVISLGLTPD